MGADEDNDEPLQENSGEFENEPSDADNKFNANVDDVEGKDLYELAILGNNLLVLRWVDRLRKQPVYEVKKL